MEEVDIDKLKQENFDKKLSQLRTLKNELIGFQEKKDFYFDKGLIETLMPMLGKEQDEKLLIEILTIINCYFFDFPKIIDCYTIFKQTFVQIHFFLQSNKDNSHVVDMVLRIIKNALSAGIVKPTDYHDQNLIESLTPLMTTRYRIQTIAKILALLSQDKYFRDQVTANKDLVLSIVTQVTKNSIIISDECIENCLSAVAAVTDGNEEISKLIYQQEGAIRALSKFIRHPDRNIKIQIAKILTQINKVNQLPREFEQTFRWILMHMVQLMPAVSHDPSIVSDLCTIIASIAENSRHPKAMQKLASDIEAIENICDILLTQKPNDADMEPSSSEMPQSQQNLLKHLFDALASLTKLDENSRKKLVEKKKVLEELLAGIKSTNREVKKAAINCFVSLTRSDKMLKSIILEAGEFQKELCNVILHADKDEDLELVTTKAIANLVLDIQKAFSKEEELIKKLVAFTSRENEELKSAAATALKNFLFKASKDIRLSVMRELTYDRLYNLLEDNVVKVKIQALLIYRNLLSSGSDDVEEVITESGERLLSKLMQFLESEDNQIITQTLYCLACIAAGAQKHKKILMEDQYFMKALDILKSTEDHTVKIGALNLFINLAYKNSDKEADSKAKKQMIDMNLKEQLLKMREKEEDKDVKIYYDRMIMKLN